MARQETDARWPFGHDAVRDDPLAMRSFAVTGSHPAWRFLVAFDKGSNARPTTAEARMLQSFLQEYIDRWYNDRFKRKLASLDLDVDSGANGVVFHKHGPDDWGYRRQSWRMGPLFLPASPRYREWAQGKGENVLGPLSLPALMDHIHDPAPGKWARWKAAHRDVFPAGGRR